MQLKESYQVHAAVAVTLEAVKRRGFDIKLRRLDVPLLFCGKFFQQVEGTVRSQVIQIIAVLPGGAKSRGEKIVAAHPEGIVVMGRGAAGILQIAEHETAVVTAHGRKEMRVLYRQHNGAETA